MNYYINFSDDALFILETALYNFDMELDRRIEFDKKRGIKDVDPWINIQKELLKKELFYINTEKSFRKKFK